MASVVHLKKLSIFCFEIVTKNKNILVKLNFYIYNQQFFFAFVIPYSLTPMTMTTMVVDLQFWI